MMDLGSPLLPRGSHNKELACLNLPVFKITVSGGWICDRIVEKNFVMVNSNKTKI